MPAATELRLKVRAVPGSARTQVVGLLGEAIKLRVAAAPEDGKANAALEKWLRSHLDPRPESIEMLAGQASRDKVMLLRYGATAAPTLAQVIENLLKTKDQN